MSEENNYEINTQETFEDIPASSIREKEKSEFEAELENYLPTPENTDKLKKPVPHWIYSVVTSALTCTVLFGIYALAVVPHMRPTAVISYTGTEAAAPAEVTEASGMSISDINSRVAPGIVTVETKASYQNFFGISSSTTTGSGIILTEDGYILTACSLIGNRRETTVVLPDNKEYSTTIVGEDTNKDIAVIKIDASGLPAVTLGNSDSVNAGDTAMVIGNTLGSGLGTSVTRGIICGVNDGVSLKNGNTINLIQTDAITGSGSAGGCLLNASGDVIGMITYAVTANNENISFAIPSNDIKNIVEALINTGNAPEALIIGITGSDTDHGVSVESVMDDTPADYSGIKTGDLILKVDGTPVKSIAEINKIRDSHKKGDNLTLTIYRDGEMTEIDVIL